MIYKQIKHISNGYNIRYQVLYLIGTTGNIPCIVACIYWLFHGLFEVCNFNYYSLFIHSKECITNNNNDDTNIVKYIACTNV